MKIIFWGLLFTVESYLLKVVVHVIITDQFNQTMR